MKPSRLALPLAALALSGTLALAAMAKAPDYVSPDQSKPGEVTFRYYAPNAHEVGVLGLRNHPEIPMTKGADGIWTATVTDLVPDIYSYSFDVDGAWVMDPRNRRFKNWVTSESVVEVDGPNPADYSKVDVPHGAVTEHFYQSQAAGRQYNFYVYTPPDYNPTSSTRYPVIVLCHGSGDLAGAWQDMGRANFIADNLIARGAMKKAIIVMPYGHPIPRPPVEKVPDGYFDENNAVMERVVLHEVLPFVESHYRVTEKPEERAIVGLSMGGGHALYIGLAHPEIFHWVGAFSAATPTKDLARFQPWINAEAQHLVHPVFIAIGRSDGLLERNEKFTAWLKEKNIPYTWTLTDGAHEWPLWRAYFSQFAQTIFK